ncbi:MAG: hypothetical protein HC887_00755 [Desulfobacteraceae bacterium]|nr:hypothetical protein [Desulfobacteraceae bacterium]
MMFGGNASLDLKGSFHVSTADYLRLGDNERFYSKPMTGEILSVAAPTAFGFLSNAPAKISIQGKGCISPENYEDEIFKGLRVFGNNSFSIIGGDIEFINGKYTTIDNENMPLGALAIPEKGRINLASAASAGEVILKPDGIDITSEKLGTIRVAEESALHVGGGQIYIRSGSFVADKGYINAGEIDLPNGKIIGGNNGLVDINVNTLSFSNDSDILIQTLGAEDAGNVNIQARKAVFAEYSSVTSATYASGNAGNISISAEELSFDTNSGITSATVGSGNAGSVKITADRLTFTSQSGINSSSLAQGNGGDVLIRAEESVSLSSSGIYSGTFSQENNAGPAGKVHIIAPELRLSDASEIWASTAGQGNAGWINFEISELEMSGKSSVASDSLSESTGGKGGGILIGQTMEQTDNTHTISQPAQNIRMQDQSYIGTSAKGQGNAGGVAIAVSQLEMDSGSVISSSSKQGEGGGIVLGKHIEVSIIDQSYLQEMDDTTIQVDQPADMIRIRNQSGISVSVEGEKNAGGIAIAAKELDMDNEAFITSSGKSSGSGGLILIGGSVSELENNSIRLLNPSDAIRIRNHSVVSTSASGQGNAGAIFMRSSDVSLDSGAAVASASLSETDGGNAGVIEIHAENISLESSAKISTSSNGQGNAGTIILETSRLNMDTDASIFSISRSENNGGDGGEIFVAGNIVGDDSSVTLQASDSIRLQNNASVSTSSNGQAKPEISYSARYRLIWTVPHLSLRAVCLPETAGTAVVLQSAKKS